MEEMVIGLVVLVPPISAAVGAAVGAVGADCPQASFKPKFVHDLKGSLEPGQAGLLLIVNETGDAAGDETDEVEKVLAALRPLGPRVLRTNLSRQDERRLVAVLARQVDAEAG